MTNYKATFERDGFLVLPKFFAEQRIDAVQAAVKAKIAARPRDVVVDVLDTNERKLLSSLTPEQIRTTRMKVNDLYLNTPAVRDIAIDTDLAKNLTLDKATPDHAAAEIVKGILAGDEDIYPDPTAKQASGLWAANPKGLEQYFAALPA